MVSEIRRRASNQSTGWCCLFLYMHSYISFSQIIFLHWTKDYKFILYVNLCLSVFVVQKVVEKKDGWTKRELNSTKFLFLFECADPESKIQATLQAITYLCCSVQSPFAPLTLSAVHQAAQHCTLLNLRPFTFFKTCLCDFPFTPLPLIGGVRSFMWSAVSKKVTAPSPVATINKARHYVAFVHRADYSGRMKNYKTSYAKQADDANVHCYDINHWCCLAHLWPTILQKTAIVSALHYMWNYHENHV